MGFLFFILLITFIVGLYVYMEQDRQNVKNKLAAAQQKADEVNLQEIEDMTRKLEVFVQADIVGNQEVIDAINNNTYDGPLPERRSDGCWLSVFDNLRILKIAGINHRKGIAAYVGKIQCALVPEPTNEFDPYAIKIVAEDSHHLGYIATEQTDMVRSFTANTFPYRCTAIIRDCEDEEDGHQFFVGSVYIKLNK